MSKPLTVWIATNCGKFSKRCEYKTCFLRNLCASQEIIELDMKQQTWFQIRKGVPQGCILSTCLFNLYADYIMRNAELDEAPAGIEIARRNLDFSNQ